MCTAIVLSGPGACFGRNLDLEGSFGEEVVLCPRALALPLRAHAPLARHAAILGMAHIAQGQPLFYDAMNEHGLAMAALNFPGFCVYHAPQEGRTNLAPFELIPYVLGTCVTLEEARTCLERVLITDTPFSSALPGTPLHFMLASKDGALAIESTADGLQVYDNPAQVMTNSPPFPWHMQRLCDFIGLSRDPAERRFGDALGLQAYSRGMGAMGLPGDLSSSSRFVRAAFARACSILPDGTNAVCQLFHLLDYAAMPCGCVRMEDGRYEYTLYSSCMDLQKRIYYYKTYAAPVPRAARMTAQAMDAHELIRFAGSD